MTARARRRPTLGAAGVIVLAVALGACSGEPSVTDPVPAASASSPGASASSTPSPTATAPAWDAAMDQVTVDGALAVGRYFLELYPYVIETGDTAEWDRLSDPECLFCTDTAEFAKTRTNTDDDLVTISISDGSGEELEPGLYYSLTFTMTSQVPSQGYSEENVVRMGVSRGGDHWLIRAVETTRADAPSGG